ncbi:hypothetical protein PHYPSEUDO_004093 [Phytophthora pseudosyringae]|uniref:Bzip transcription factor n=1 Tax=Phytophthora pseudosyringae TaxID=221518 RepID=A0A8T1WEH4_9STRA|nr:hypothetical protein PHYPSEUDO_004093 [Phytophthora pseudosyringae]
MASQFETPGLRFHRFESARSKLSDGLVGLVRPRVQVSGWQAAANTAGDIVSDTNARGLTHSRPDNNGRATASLKENRPREDLRKRSRYDLQTPYHAGVESPRMDQSKQDLKRVRLKLQLRREQCRTNQARYRNKQRNLQQHLETTVQELRQELDRLKQQRQDILLAEKTDQSPWTIVAEVFRIIDNSFCSPWNLEREEDVQNDIETKRNLAFLHQAFTSNVAVGGVSGIDTVIEQWRRVSQYFGDTQLQLQRVESVVQGVITASAKLRFTVTELTLRQLFPHVLEFEPQSKYDVHPFLRERLLGQHIDCSVSVTFLFDDENGRVTRVEPQIDLMPGLLRVLRNLSDVSEVCYSDLPTSGDEA